MSAAGAGKVNLTIARSKAPGNVREVIYLQATEHVVIRSCTVEVQLIQQEQRPPTPQPGKQTTYIVTKASQFCHFLCGASRRQNNLG